MGVGVPLLLPTHKLCPNNNPYGLFSHAQGGPMVCYVHHSETSNLTIASYIWCLDCHNNVMGSAKKLHVLRLCTLIDLWLECSILAVVYS